LTVWIPVVQDGEIISREIFKSRIDSRSRELVVPFTVVLLSPPDFNFKTDARPKHNAPSLSNRIGVDTGDDSFDLR
jgi:hypothetical protein